MRPSEFNELPWWEQKIATEGLLKEKPWIYRTAMMKKAQDPLRDAFPDEGFADDDDFLHASGFVVRTVQVESPTE